MFSLSCVTKSAFNLWPAPVVEPSGAAEASDCCPIVRRRKIDWLQAPINARFLLLSLQTDQQVRALGSETAIFPKGSTLMRGEMNGRHSKWRLATAEPLCVGVQAALCGDLCSARRENRALSGAPIGGAKVLLSFLAAETAAELCWKICLLIGHLWLARRSCALA